MKLDWLDDIEENRYEELFEFYQKEWWTAGRTLDGVIEMIKGSNVVVGCTDEKGELVGFARVLTDYIYKAFIFDVVIRADARGQHVGAEIVSHIMNLESIRDVDSFELYCPNRFVPFYEKLGFEKSNSHLMTKSR